MEFMQKFGAAIIAVIVVVFACIGIMAFGPLIILFAVPLLMLAGCVWILKSFRKKDSSSK